MNKKKIVFTLMASLAMNGVFGMVSFAETATKSPSAVQTASKTTEKDAATKKKTDKKKADSKPVKETPSSTPAGKSGVTADKNTPAKSVATGDYHGNTVDHIFHKSSCRYYKSKNNTAIFKTREEAIKAGYRPCKICKP